MSKETAIEHIEECKLSLKETTIRRNDLEHLAKVRQGWQKGITPCERNVWLFEAVILIMNTLNDAVTHQDWVSFIEPIQIARYFEGDHYDIHFDGFTPRKISLTIQLSDPDNYTGGELEIGLPNNPVTAPKEVGTAILFPSWMPHAVKPVTSGIRYSLVAWGHGPTVR